MRVKLLAFSGSLRQGSLNQTLVEHAAKLAENHGAQVKVIRLADYPMPLYDQDIEDEKGIPDEALKFRELLKSHQGFLISSPEYNSSISGALKNAIDWASRPKEGEEPLECFKCKAVGLMAASPGGLGGVRGLDHVREILSNIQCHIVPGLVSVSGADNAFGDDGKLKNDRQRQMLDTLIERTVAAAKKVGVTTA